MTLSFEPALQLAGTPAVLVRSLDDAIRVLREYTGHRRATRDLILCRLTAASSAEQRYDAASSFRWWAEQEGLFGPGLQLRDLLRVPISHKFNADGTMQLVNVLFRSRKTHFSEHPLAWLEQSPPTPRRGFQTSSPSPVAVANRKPFQ